MNLPVVPDPPPDLGRELYFRKFPGVESEKPRVIAELIQAITGGESPEAADRFRLQLCLDEAIQNAIRHGNRFDPEKSIEVRVAEKDDVRRVLIRDQGGGFDPEKVPDPRAEEGLERESGRGLFILKEYMDEVRFYEGGRALVLSRRLRSAAARV